MKATMTAVLTVLVAAATSADEGAMAKKYGDQFEKRSYTDAAGNKILYRLLKPAGYDPASAAAYPLVIFLHGAGERGDDNEAQLIHGAPEFATPEMRKKHPCFVIAPQCPKGQSWAKVDRKGGELVASLPKDPTEPTRLVLELMDSIAKEFHIDPTRVYLTGLSMGGFGTWDILARHSERFSAAMPVAAAASKTQPRPSPRFRCGYFTAAPTRSSNPSCRGAWSKPCARPAASLVTASTRVSATIRGRLPITIRMYWIGYLRRRRSEAEDKGNKN